MVGIHTAFQDSTPLILFVGQVAREAREREAFQEIDVKQMFGHTAKWAAEISDPDMRSNAANNVFHQAAANAANAGQFDLAAELAMSLAKKEFRAALVASTPAQLANHLNTLASWLAEGITARSDLKSGIFLGAGNTIPRIGFLFPGQGSPAHLDGGILRRRFDGVRELYHLAQLPAGADGVATQVAQPAVCTASLAGLRVLSDLKLNATVAVGHSLDKFLCGQGPLGGVPKALDLACQFALQAFLESRPLVQLAEPVLVLGGRGSLQAEVSQARRATASPSSR